MGAFSGGLLAKSEPILSMSTFQKAPQSSLLDYDPTRALQDHVSYPAYGQPPYVTQLLSPSMESHVSQESEGLPYMTDQGFAGPVPLEQSRSSIFGFHNRQVLEVTSYSPQRGCEGTRVFVHVRSPYDLRTPSCTAFFLSFGSKKCECAPQLLNVQDSAFQYLFSVDTPAFISTMSHSFAVPLQFVVDHQSNHSPTVVQVGVYTYEQAAHPSFSEDARKRGVTSTPMAPKRQPIQQLEVKGDPDTHSYNEDNPGQYSPFMSPETTTAAYPSQYVSDNSPSPSFNHYVGSTGVSPSALKAPSPLTTSWNGPFTTASGMPFAAAQQAISSPTRPANPTLIRTSTIPQSNNLGQVQPFNPYAMYPTKAVLKLNGDLDSMIENWSADERDAKRRLVQFTRVQNGSTIHADFKPVSPEDRAPNSICISCIHWEGKNECFVTSVDTIYLLESLVGVRFTVEEKNRIRRNLEGFRPLTVSKAKADSEEFFKVIMGFPAPKPRNIEKDVKVFPWKILGHALKKIIGKYSASYSSTAGALPTPLNTGYASNGSDAGNESQRASSPQSVSESTTPSTYAASLTPTAFSPPMMQSKPSLNNCVTSAPELGVTLAGVSHPYTSVPVTYAYQTSCPGSQPLLAGRPSWEFGALVNNNIATVPNTNSGNFPYAAVPYSVNPMTSGV